MTKARLVRLAISLLLGLAFAAAIAWWSVEQERRASAPMAGMIPAASVGGDFAMIDHTGKPVTQADYAGKYKLMFFGYTFCPDICPTELQTVAQAVEMLGGEAAKVQPIFVTVDPQRDTPQQLAEYVALFHPSIVGLTGAPEQVAAMAKSWRVYYDKAPGGDPDGYLMDHSTYVYLMTPDNKLVTVFARGTAPEEIVKTTRQAIAAGAQG
ncbi:MAG TPA: SCO family protein [Azospirillaceae bacterium]|nr:SCO family protein [Azospirillaceae bacterium]